MKLYGFPPSPNTWKVRAVAAHLGIKLDFVLVDLTKPRTPEYLTIHPAGRTPALVDGDFTLTESNAIMQYLASQKPNASPSLTSPPSQPLWRRWSSALYRSSCLPGPAAQWCCSPHADLKRSNKIKAEKTLGLLRFDFNGGSFSPSEAPPGS